MPATNNAPFPITPALVAIAVMYKNARMIADDVAPRISVPLQEFRYMKHNLADGFTVPETKVGRKGLLNEVNFTATEATGATQDYGLSDPIPQTDINNAIEGQDPEGQSVEYIANLLELDREVRTAALVFNASNYATPNKEVLSGTDQFSDFTNSDPLAVITAALDSMVMRGNAMTIGREAFSILRRHPQLVGAVQRNSGTNGIITRQELADLLELENIYVGEGRINNARKGQAASLNRVWGKHISLMFQDGTASIRNTMTFALTAQWGDRIAGSEPDSKIGLRGGQRVRAGESVKELLTANDLGYFIENVVA